MLKYLCTIMNIYSICLYRVIVSFYHFLCNIPKFDLGMSYKLLGSFVL